MKDEFEETYVVLARHNYYVEYAYLSSCYPLNYYSKLKDWLDNGTLSVELWKKYCEKCLEFLQKELDK